MNSTLRPPKAALVAFMDPTAIRMRVPVCQIRALACSSPVVPGSAGSSGAASTVCRVKPFRAAAQHRSRASARETRTTRSGARRLQLPQRRAGQEGRDHGQPIALRLNPSLARSYTQAVEGDPAKPVGEAPARRLDVAGQILQQPEPRPLERPLPTRAGNAANRRDRSPCADRNTPAVDDDPKAMNDRRLDCG